jgi:hypothetical protein
MKSYIAISVNVLVFVFLMLPAVSVSGDLSKQEYESAYQKLVSKYKDSVVTTAFDRGDIDSASFLREMYSRQCFAVEDGTPWYGTFRSLMEKLSKKGSLQDAEPSLHEILNSPENERRNALSGLLTDPGENADLLLVTALASKNAGHYRASLHILERLLLLHKNDPTNWSSCSGIFK